MRPPPREVTIGSANFDRRSSLLNDELTIRIEDGGVAARHWKLSEEDLPRSRTVRIGSCKARGLGEKSLDSLAYQIRDQL